MAVAGERPDSLTRTCLENCLMKRILECLCLALVLTGFAGCSGQSDELAPVTESPAPPTEEEMKKMMEESMKQGGMNNVTMPEASTATGGSPPESDENDEND